MFPSALTLTKLSGSGIHLKIGALSKQADCNIETIRYYERIRLLPVPPRTHGGYRLYGLEHLKRLNFIRRARELGFTLNEVRALLKLADDRSQSCGEVRALATAHLDDVCAKIAESKNNGACVKGAHRTLRDWNVAGVSFSRGPA
jgi:MerR family transcriptional regulator, mercuric resistance operon regulatory protein